jgi:DNA-binding transcriptional ArsR family regulator
MSDAPLDPTDGSERDSTGASSAVTPDSAFAALADPQRRAVLSYLHDRPGESVSVEALVNRLVSRMDDATRRHIAASLSRTQLPKLDELNLVEYDRERRVVRYIDSPLVSELLARIRESED